MEELNLENSNQEIIDIEKLSTKKNEVILDKDNKFKVVEKDYYDIPAISQSQVKDFLKSPFHFWQNSVFNPNKKEKEMNEGMRLGKICHCLLLEPENFKKEFGINPSTNFLTKEGKKFKIEQEELKKIAINQSDVLRATKMIECLKKNKEVSKFLYGSLTEKPIIIKDKNTGLTLKGKLDCIKRLQTGEIIVIDYKTSCDVNAFLKWGYKEYNYIQIAMYNKLVREKYGREIDYFYFIIQSIKKDEEEVICIADYMQEGIGKYQCILRYGENKIDEILLKIADKLEKYEKTKDSLIWSAFEGIQTLSFHDSMLEEKNQDYERF